MNESDAQLVLTCASTTFFAPSSARKLQIVGVTNTFLIEGMWLDLQPVAEQLRLEVLLVEGKGGADVKTHKERVVASSQEDKRDKPLWVVGR